VRIAIYNRVFNIEDVPVFELLFKVLEQYEAKVMLYYNLVTQLTNVVQLPEQYTTFGDGTPLPVNTDYIISLGGDGTILDTVCHVANLDIPILGINLGNLGFLANNATSEIEYVFDCLLKDKYNLERRTLLHLDTNKPLFDHNPFALNDFCIQRKDSNALVKIHTYLNGEFLCTYWADGLIISTPTGSTGYSLSCGGPIIMPQANSFVITPVAPHNLNIRPIIIPDETIVSLEVEGRAKEYLCSLDARTAVIDSTFSLGIRKEDFTIPLVKLSGQNFLSTIRQKLYWGLDRRN
jgi:NAD+ kinase